MSEANTTSAGDLTRTLSAAIQSHPLPAALIGMGLVWLFSGGGKSLLGGGETDVSGVAKRANSDVTSFGASNLRVFATTQSNIAHLLDRQPLVLGAIGLGVGAAMAAALPSTAVETGLLGQASADLQARTREIAGQVTDRAADLADGVTAAVTKEAEAQGLTAESLKQSASGASRKVKNIVAQSTDRLHSVTRSQLVQQTGRRPPALRASTINGKVRSDCSAGGFLLPR
jgi:hypothetical protein